MLEFQTPWLLYLVWMIPSLAAWWLLLQHRRARALAAFVPPTLQPRLCPSFALRRPYAQTALVTAAALLLLITAAGPRWGEREESVLQQSRDLIIVLDVSLSMLANDVHPSRLQRAKVDCMDLIDELRGDRAALLVFRHKPALVCPLTTDYTFLRQALAGISPESAPRGETDIGAAIARALEAFDETEASHKAIILISDGEDLSGLAGEKAEEAGQRGIPIYTVGIGSRAGSTLPDPRNPGDMIRFEGQPVISRIDHESLHTIARKTGGSYVPIETAGTGSTTLGMLYRDHLRNISRRTLAESRQRRTVERFQWFLLPAFIFLTAACALSRGRFATGSKRGIHVPPGSTAGPAGVACLLLSFAITAPAAISQPDEPVPPAASRANPRDTARLAQRRFRQGAWEDAATLYLSAAEGSPRNAARTYRHNAAIALAQAGRHREAASIFSALANERHRGDRDAHLPLGITLYHAAGESADDDPDDAQLQADTLQQAGEAFRQALRSAPDNTLRHDLALTLRQIPDAKARANALRLAAEHAQRSPDTLATQMLNAQRTIATDIFDAATNALPDRIRAFEALAQRQGDNADLWLPLQAKLMEALAQQPDDEQTRQAVAALQPLIQVTRENMADGRQRLRDLDEEGFRSAKMAEQGIYQLWKSLAPYERLLDETRRQQTEAIAQTEGARRSDPTLTPAELQHECAELTALFRQRFEKAVPPEGMAEPAVEPGAEPEGITAETRARILELANSAERFQRAAAEYSLKDARGRALEAQREADTRLEEISRLLPPPPPRPPEQQVPDKDQDKDSPPEDAPGQASPPQTGDEKQGEPVPTEPAERPENEDDIRAILQRTLEREKEHQDEKRRREQRIPLPPTTRDW